jgi:CRISPR/Cas system-associated exonuclease Cas4 (RecB family)
VVREVEIGATERAAVLETLASIQEVVTTEMMPRRAPAARCRDCVYRRTCV